MNASAQRHPWYDQCGNDVLYYHAQTGALDAIKDWSAAGNIPNESLPPTSKEKKNCFTLLFVTGGVYVDYMVNRSVSPTSYPVKNVEIFFVTFSQ